VEQLMKIHEAQVLTYMKLAKIGIGLLINFNVQMLKGDQEICSLSDILRALRIVEIF
jgi:GxxExxY protein